MLTPPNVMVLQKCRNNNDVREADDDRGLFWGLQDMSSSYGIEEYTKASLNMSEHIFELENQLTRLVEQNCSYVITCFPYVHYCANTLIYSPTTSWWKQESI